jgi:DNA-binding NarL/FixJ family response regulator
MPGIDSRRALKTIKNIIPDAHTKVLVIADTTQKVETLRQLEADDYLANPLNGCELEEKAKQLLELPQSFTRQQKTAALTT